jgi:hypothetical protein
MVTPATLQLGGICCSMSSTKLSWLVLLVLFVVVVLVVPAAPAPLDAPTAGALAPTAPLEAPVAGTLAPTDAPAGELELVVLVVEELVGVAARMSMNSTVWPLLARFRKVPLIGIVEADVLLPVAGVLLVAEVPPLELVLAPAPLLVAKEPAHWLGLSICW